MKIYIVRHGQDDNSVRGGWSNCPLADLGVQQSNRLADEFLAKYMKEMVKVSKAVSTAFDCDKMNYECLGNGDTHLHWHLFPRVEGDLGEYGNNGKGPVWWLPQEIMWNKDNVPNKNELEEMKAKLIKALE